MESSRSYLDSGYNLGTRDAHPPHEARQTRVYAADARM